jgi:hypothetical protein
MYLCDYVFVPSFQAQKWAYICIRCAEIYNYINRNILSTVNSMHFTICLSVHPPPPRPFARPPVCLSVCPPVCLSVRRFVCWPVRPSVLFIGPIHQSVRWSVCRSVYLLVCPSIHPYVCMCVHTYIHTHICMCVPTYTHTCAHTHTSWCRYITASSCVVFYCSYVNCYCLCNYIEAESAVLILYCYTE